MVSALQTVSITWWRAVQAAKRYQLVTHVILGLPAFWEVLSVVPVATMSTVWSAVNLWGLVQLATVDMDCSMEFAQISFARLLTARIVVTF